MNIRFIVVLAVLTVSGCAAGLIRPTVRLSSAEALSIATRFAEHDHFDFDRYEFKEVRVLQSSGRMLWFATWRRKGIGINDIVVHGDFPVVVVDDDTNQVRWMRHL